MKRNGTNERTGGMNVLKKGDKVMVLNNLPSGVLIEEGVAKLVKYLGTGDSYHEDWMVEFDAEPGATYRRRVSVENKQV